MCPSDVRSSFSISLSLRVPLLAVYSWRMNRRELVTRCLRHCELEPTDSLHDDEHSLKGLFADHRGRADDLRALLDGVPDADEIVERFAWLSEGVSPADEYAIPPASEVVRVEVEPLVRAHFQAVGALLREAGHGDKADEIVRPREIEWSHPSVDVFDDCEHFDDYADYVGDQVDESHPAAGLGEAAYGFAAQYELKWYLLWCTYRANVTADEPFRAAAELWRRDVQWARSKDRIFIW